MSEIAARRAAALACAALLVCVTIVTQPMRALAGPSDELSKVLSELRFLGSSDFADVVRWAKNGHEPPSNPAFSRDVAEADIATNLNEADRNAVLAWLTGHGRGPLHDQGASNSEIGPQRADIDASSAAAAPNLWRAIPLATATLEGGTQGGIQILGGFTAIKRDGTSANVCVSFKNVDQRVAKRVVIEFPLLNGDGQELGKLVLDRAGEFSPNIDIRSYDSMTAWQTPGGGPASAFLMGCVRRDLATAALPLINARTSGYRVARVDYADGASWTAETAAKSP